MYGLRAITRTVGISVCLLDPELIREWIKTLPLGFFNTYGVQVSFGNEKKLVQRDKRGLLTVNFVVVWTSYVPPMDHLWTTYGPPMTPL